MKQTTNILIVEDDPLVLRGFETILRQDGYKIFPVNSGQKALDLISQKSFDIVLTDLKMEGISGLDILEEVKKITPNTPVIVITGYESLESAVCALRSGAYDYLIKPCQDNDLKLTIKRGLEKMRLEKELLGLATTDSLTKLYNRNYFLSRFEEEFKKATRYKNNISCVMIDIDHFKSINDNYGHQRGDEVLMQLSEIFKINSRNIDIVGRYGGEEFIIILPQTDSQSAYKFSDRLRKIIKSHEFKLNTIKIIRITISIGVSSFPQSKVKSYSELIQLADNALYSAKRKGRDKSVLSMES